MISINNGKYYYWQVKISDVLVRGQSVFSNTYTMAILDTGSYLTVLPLKEMTRIASSISKKFDPSKFNCSSGAQIYCAFQALCSDIALQLEPIQFKLNGSWGFNVAPEDFLLNTTY